MNKFLEKQIPKLPYGLLEPMGLVSFLLSFSSTYLILVQIINNSILIFILSTILFFIFGYYLANAFALFRKKQIEWLRSNGVKITARFNKLGLNIDWEYGDDLRKIYVNGEWAEKRKMFKSDAISSGRIGHDVAKNMLMTRIKNHDETLDVWINPEYPKVYWVDTDFLK